MLLASVVSVVAEAANPRSDLTSEADRPSTEVPSIRKKSSSATPLVNTATLPLLIPVSAVDDEPNPIEVRAVAPVSSTKFEPSPTIKPPSVTARPATSWSCASRRALATVPES